MEMCFIFAPLILLFNQLIQIQMKKFYSLMSVALLSAVTAFGQLSMRTAAKNNAAPPSERQRPAQTNPNARLTDPQNNTQAIIWSDDFSNASNWTIANEVGNTDDWVIGTDPPSGAYAIAPITSTSAANGFALYDSDLMCSGDQVGNLTNANAIDCSGHPNVRVRFEQYYRRYIDSTYLYVSNDGVNWTQFQVNQSLQVNDFTPSNPTMTTIDITSVAGNQATVYIRFQFYSPASLGTGAGCAYAWMVDDVVLEDVPADDVAMVPSYPSQYTMIPLTQVQPIDLAATIANVGGNSETNVGFTANVYLFQGSWTQVFNGVSSTAANLNAGDTSTLLTAGLFNITDTGIYAFEYISFMDNADGDQSNDTLLAYIVVNDSTYARDEAAITGMLDNSLGFNANTGNLGNIYDAVVSTSVKSISIFCAAPTEGDQVTVSMYSVTGGMPDVNLSTSSPYTFTADDETNGVFLTLPLSNPVAVSGGNQFFVCADQLGQNNLTLGYNLNINTPATTYFQVAGGGWNELAAGGFPGTLLVRANLDLDDKVMESEFAKGISMFPNPTNGKLYIHNNGQKADMTVTVYNNVGQLVYTRDFTQMTNAVVDLTEQSEGVYTVQIKSGNEVATRSVVISNN
jgi:hypothetical protein